MSNFTYCIEDYYIADEVCVFLIADVFQIQPLDGGASPE